jgi:hypothetical protein
MVLFGHRFTTPDPNRPRTGLRVFSGLPGIYGFPAKLAKNGLPKNIVLGNQIAGPIGIDQKATRRVAEEHLAEIDDRIDPKSKVGDLSAANGGAHRSRSQKSLPIHLTFSRTRRRHFLYLTPSGRNTRIWRSNLGAPRRRLHHGARSASDE